MIEGPKGKIKWSARYTAKFAGDTTLCAELLPLSFWDRIAGKKLADFEITVERIYVYEGKPCVDLKVSWWIDV